MTRRDQSGMPASATEGGLKVRLAVINLPEVVDALRCARINNFKWLEKLRESNLGSQSFSANGARRSIPRAVFRQYRLSNLTVQPIGRRSGGLHERASRV